MFVRLAGCACALIAAGFAVSLEARPAPPPAVVECVPMGLFSPNGTVEVKGDQRTYKFHQSCTLQTNEIGEPVMKVTIEGVYFVSTKRATERIVLNWQQKGVKSIHYSLFSALTCDTDPWSNVSFSCAIVESDQMSGDFVKPYYDPAVRPYSATKISKVIKAEFAKALKSFPGTSKPCDPNAKPVANIPFAAPKFSIAPSSFPGSYTMTAPVPLPFCTHPEGIVVQFQHFKNNSWSLVNYKGALTGTLSPEGKGTVTLADLGGKEKGKYRVRAWIGGKFFLKNGKTAWMPFELQ